MSAKKPMRGKKYFTAAEADAALPLVRAIVRDITELATDLRERYERLTRARSERGAMMEVYREEWQPVEEEFERGQERLREYQEELEKLGVHLKDPHTGLVDFPCWMDNREVCLCWRYGEPEVAYWHEIDAGFAGRQKLPSRKANPVKQ
jgi:hypothetical protein